MHEIVGGVNCEIKAQNLDAVRREILVDPKYITLTKISFKIVIFNLGFGTSKYHLQFFHDDTEHCLFETFHRFSPSQ